MNSKQEIDKILDDLFEQIRKEFDTKHDSEFMALQAVSKLTSGVEKLMSITTVLNQTKEKK